MVDRVKIVVFSLLSGNNYSFLVSPSFLKSSLIYTISGALPLASGFVLLPLYTNHLSTSNYGLLALAIGASVLFQAFFSFSLDSVLYLNHHKIKNSESQLKQFYGSVLSASLLLASILTLFVGIGSGWLFPSIFKEGGKEISYLGYTALVSGFFTAFTRLYSHILMLHDKPWSHLTLNGIGFVLTLLFTVIGVNEYPDTVWGAMGGRVFAFGLIFLASICLYIRRYPPKVDYKIIRAMLNDALPIFLYTIILSLTANADVFILNQYLTKAEVGLFDLAIKLSIAVDFIMNAMWNSSLPQVTASLESIKNRRSTPLFNSYFHLLTLLLVVVSVGTLIVFPPIVKLLVTNPSYHHALQWLPLSVASYSFRVLASYFLVTLFYYKKNLRLVYLYLILLAIKFVLSPFMASHWGVTGLFGSMYLFRLAEVVLLYLAGRDIFTYNPNVIKLIGLPILLWISSIVIFLIFDLRVLNFALIFSEMSILVLVIFVYRMELISWVQRLNSYFAKQ